MVMKSNWLDRWLPGLALKRTITKIRLEAAKRTYDAAKTSNYRAMPTDSRSADGVMENARDKIRKWARHLDENHDISIGLLDVLVNNIVGTGVMIEPLVMTKGGKPADKFNKQLRKLLKDWWAAPEVTGELPFGEAQRLICRTWLRDGETLIQHVRGRAVTHGSAVPYSLELIEPDLLPFDALTGDAKVVHGVEKDSWGRPVAYHFYKEHPGNQFLPYAALSITDLRRTPAKDIVHLKFTRRFRQTRGVPILHGVINRLADIKDYEESERIAARVAASLTAFIKKNGDFLGEADATSGDRSFEMQAGMIFDNLQNGEDVGMIKSERPNPGMGEFLKTQMRALAAGTGTNYSQVAKDYNGTYSAQRQELVESQPAYARLREYFVAIFMRRIYQEFVSAAIASGLLPMPRTIDPETLFDADMRAPGLPWIDPKKEIEAEVLAIQQRIKSRTQVIRDHGGDPDVVEQQIIRERDRDRETGLGATQPGDAGGDQGGEGSGQDDGDGDEGTGADSAAA